MKIRNSDAGQTTKKLTVPKKRSKKSRAARTKANKKRRRRFRAALSLHKSRNSKRVEPSPHPETFVRAPFVVQLGQSGMSGNWYWLNYNNVFQWKDHHLSNYGVAAYSLPGQSHWPLEKREVPHRSAEVRISGLQSTAGSYKSFGTSAAPELDFSGEGYDEEDIASDVGSDEDIVVTEEMMQFLEISMRHKASLDEKKQEAKILEDKKILQEERDANEDCLVPSDAADDEKRHDEMAVLYGENAPMIHGMETALQLSFNRQVDLFNPPYWPVHPFTIQFRSS